MAEDETRVVRNDAEGRYELWLGDTLAGRAEFELQDAGTAFTHTEVDPAFEGQGLGSVLARGALEDAASRDEIIVPYCPFIRAYVKRHHEFDAHVLLPTPKHERREQ
ncbi:hypothetical protein SAMN04489806_1887 [Paramicrobacterium humi]|jgi:predicted GNAT family acetyltransferase|uniref:N-acetyltransferase domain-containing protein n=1 Tax=Paramicrobacterium humi TaxID=640635 RepID=A0A1H4MII7_9MICO|nr:GNAT family N-acetyltransferase [Microbacterium humi]SEB82930.1 hypothetical protein SAMN04489806_1887 [Microbacterium humi]